MQILAFLLGLLAFATIIKAQSAITWVFFAPGSNCDVDYNGASNSQLYWTYAEAHCVAMRLGVGEYDCIVNGVQTGDDGVMPPMWACPDKNCDLQNCALMVQNNWGGNGLGCQHMYNSPYWFVGGVDSWKRGLNETEAGNGTFVEGVKGDGTEMKGMKFVA